MISTNYTFQFRFYSNCSCSTINNQPIDPELKVATLGACNNEKCALHWRLFQGLSVFAASLLGKKFGIFYIFKIWYFMIKFQKCVNLFSSNWICGELAHYSESCASFRQGFGNSFRFVHGRNTSACSGQNCL